MSDDFETWLSECNLSSEGLISDYFRKRNGTSYSYCMKCNASTQHLNGVCRNCPEPNNIRPPMDKKVVRKPPMYDITNITPSQDPDDAIESLMKLGLEVQIIKCNLCDEKFPISDIGGQANHLKLNHDIDNDTANSEIKSVFYSLEE